jgi:UDP-glucose 4-epimerase
MVDAVRTVTGHPLPVVIGPRRAGDPARLVASSARIAADLGWAPVHTELTEIVADAWDFARR